MRKLLTLLTALLLIVGVAASSFGQMSLTGAGGTKPPSAPVGPPVLTYVTSVNGSSHSGSTETFTGLSIGPATDFTTRRIIFSSLSNDILTSGTGTITGVLINGTIPATIHVQQCQGGSGTPMAAIYSADIPTGTTATVAVTFDGPIFNDHLINVYSVDDALLASKTPQNGSIGI